MIKEFSVFSIFQSGMVLQQKKPIVIWGTAPASSAVTVQLLQDTPKGTICLHTAAACAGSQDSWRCKLPAHPAGEHFSLIISCDKSKQQPIILEQISIGEVWLACGQSNMEFFLRYDKDWENIQRYPQNPKIHMYNVPQLAFKGQQKDTTGWGTWLMEGDKGFETFSAPGYSFARNIQPHIQVPIGIIGCNWGGTTASAWLDETCLEKEPLNIYLKEYEQALKEYTTEELEQISLKSWEFEVSEKHGEDFTPLMYGRSAKWQQQYMKEHASDPVIPMGPWSINRPGGLYHQMLEPLIPFAFQGVLWYQGESDAYHADLYDQLLTALITCWRQKWDASFPFLFVQLAPFGRWLQCDSSNYCKVREKQALVSKTVPNTGMVSVMDIGSYYDIHPKAKMEVGRRLALLARGMVYGETLLCQSPELISAHAEAAMPSAEQSVKITLTFNNCQQLSVSRLASTPLDTPSLEERDRTVPYTQQLCAHEIKGFCLMQDNREATISSLSVKGNQVILYAELKPGIPCTVSLAWADYAVVNLVNEAGLPIKPFITVLE